MDRGVTAFPQGFRQMGDRRIWELRRLAIDWHVAYRTELGANQTDGNAGAPPRLGRVSETTARQVPRLTPN